MINFTISDNSTDDVIDVRNIIERYEELQEEKDSDNIDEDEQDELGIISALLESLAGNGGDHHWRGEWYPVTLINEDYFTEYAEELASDIGAIQQGAKWPNNHIDWEAVADELRQDYTAVSLGDETYLYR